jgi:hypothetical protein
VLSSAPEGINLLCSPNADRGVMLQSCNFQLIHFFFFALLAGYFSRLTAYFPPSLFSTVIFLFNTTTLRPHHHCLPLLCGRCRRHPSPLAPPAAYCVTVAVIGPPPLLSPSLYCHRAAAAPPAQPPPLHLNVALDVHNLAASPQHGLLPVVQQMGFVGSVLHNHE